MHKLLYLTVMFHSLRFTIGPLPDPHSACIGINAWEYQNHKAISTSSLLYRKEVSLETLVAFVFWSLRLVGRVLWLSPLLAICFWKINFFQYRTILIVIQNWNHWLRKEPLTYSIHSPLVTLKCPKYRKRPTISKYPVGTAPLPTRILASGPRHYGGNWFNLVECSISGRRQQPESLLQKQKQKLFTISMNSLIGYETD